MRGIVDQVWENQSRNGRDYLSVQIDGERYNVWDNKYFDSLEPGAEIEYECKQSGNFRHLTDVRPADGNGRPDGNAGDNGGNGPRASSPFETATYKDRQIARLSCLKSASEILAPVQLDPDAKKDVVIDTARYFERYVLEDGEAPPPEEGQGDGRARNRR